MYDQYYDCFKNSPKGSAVPAVEDKILIDQMWIGTKVHMNGFKNLKMQGYYL
jgi:hypothetical protein